MDNPDQTAHPRPIPKTRFAGRAIAPGSAWAHVVLVNPPLSVTRRSHTTEVMYAVEATAFGMRAVFNVKVSAISSQWVHGVRRDSKIPLVADRQHAILRCTSKTTCWPSRANHDVFHAILPPSERPVPRLFGPSVALLHPVQSLGVRGLPPTCRIRHPTCRAHIRQFLSTSASILSRCRGLNIDRLCAIWQNGSSRLRRSEILQ